MTKQSSLASQRASEASSSPNRPSTPIIQTPPSESSAPSNLATANRQPSSLIPTGKIPEPHPLAKKHDYGPTHAAGGKDSDNESDADDDFDGDMPQRPLMHRPTDGRSEERLLKDETARESYDGSIAGAAGVRHHVRRATFRSQDIELDEKSATKKKYTYAAFFLGLSLISFVVQTETAVYIQHELGWNKAYCMLWMTHGSWSLLWPVSFAILRFKNRHTPFDVFWKRHVAQLRSTAQMVRYQVLHPSPREAEGSPVPYILRTTAFVTSALTVAGGSWYVAVDLTSASDLTAIYNCSAFFAYAFSIPLLGDKIRFDKVFSVGIAIVGVLIVAYGDAKPTKHGGKSGGAVGGGPPEAQDLEAKNRLLGNIIIGIGSVLYGLYEVLYKRWACPPEGTSPGRGMIFAMTFGSLIRSFTLLVLWIPMPILHMTGIEKFELPTGEAAWMMAISALANATFSGSFLVLISLTSPVLSSVAALLTIFLVAIVDTLLPNGEPISIAAVIGGVLIIAAFLILSWSTYRELDEERRKRIEQEGAMSDSDD